MIIIINSVIVELISFLPSPTPPHPPAGLAHFATPDTSCVGFDRLTPAPLCLPGRYIKARRVSSTC